uniref:MULE transposase domain-containing protein n=1 Tax=Tanacetum cinerariifolium TaxID=118510 RepID=A0A699GZP0_TANCI|nr:hypothetical protein CTI12_AA105810 [Tanacetum cinerariifolium]
MISQQKSIACPFRNYNLGSLVNFKWIVSQYGKEILANPFIPYRKMKDDIRVRQAILDSNHGSTCRLDVFESDGSPYFKRMYICFKGVKDGWLAGCKKVIGLDGCFLKYTCRGELLTAMGRDANNQIYPIAWAVVRVENAENWSCFLALLHDDLALNDGTCITIMSDSHKFASAHYIGTGLSFLVVSKSEKIEIDMRVMKKGHNKASCKNETRPKHGIKKPPSRKRQPVTGKTASRGGLGCKGGRKGGRGMGGKNSSRCGGDSSRECPSSGAGTIKLWSDGHLTAQQIEEETHEAVIEESHQDVVEETHEIADEGKAVDKGKAISEVPHDTTEQAKVDKDKAVDDTTKQGKSGNKKRNRQK